MALSHADVKKVASLARLEVSDQEVELLAGQLGDVLAYIEQLGEVNTENIEPMAHALEQINVLADDIASPSFPREQMLQNAPRRDEECYRVPPVLGE